MDDVSSSFTFYRYGGSKLAQLRRSTEYALTTDTRQIHIEYMALA